MLMQYPSLLTLTIMNLPKQKTTSLQYEGLIIFHTELAMHFFLSAFKTTAVIEIRETV